MIWTFSELDILALNISEVMEHDDELMMMEESPMMKFCVLYFMESRLMVVKVPL